ncbi:putative LRR receptor-like serine/threonine-protein kinase [Morus notabilis]|uniref:Putative LRR receptor-like serine/threonine-protein kinase n=1 Tax=Morus notabilis TaxID=981085 RepID=W9QG97_9ROSA|nr:putative LRR receptor-like serine/threonine-protein kinase [Morus notabilis]
MSSAESSGTIEAKTKSFLKISHVIVLISLLFCKELGPTASRAQTTTLPDYEVKLKISHVIVLISLLFCKELGPTASRAQTTTLPDYEVQAIEEIAAQLNKKDWNFSDPCSNKTTVNSPHTDQYFNTIICNCSISPNVCHIQSIDFSGQDLDGVLPPSVAKLPYLKKLNLGQNYLSGSIPREWASTKLEFLRISSNNFTGKIPDFFQSWKQLENL